MVSGPVPAVPVVTVLIHPHGAPESMRAECRRRLRASRRVRVREVDEATPPPGECRLELPGYAGLARRSLARLCAFAHAHPAGPVHVLLPGATGTAEAIRLCCGRTDPTGPPRWEAASRFGIVDLRHPAAPPPWLERVGRWAQGWLPVSGYRWLGARVKQLRRRVRDRLFLD